MPGHFAGTSSAPGREAVPALRPAQGSTGHGGWTGVRPPPSPSRGCRDLSCKGVLGCLPGTACGAVAADVCDQDPGGGQGVGPGHQGGGGAEGPPRPGWSVCRGLSPPCAAMASGPKANSVGPVSALTVALVALSLLSVSYDLSPGAPMPFAPAQDTVLGLRNETALPPCSGLVFPWLTCSGESCLLATLTVLRGHLRKSLGSLDLGLGF